jgi:hypothetical protein
MGSTETVILSGYPWHLERHQGDTAGRWMTHRVTELTALDVGFNAKSSRINVTL